MHRPQQRHVILTAAIVETDRGSELRIGFTDRHLTHTQCSAIDDYPLLERAATSVSSFSVTAGSNLRHLR